MIAGKRHRLKTKIAGKDKMTYTLPELELMQIQTVKESDREGTYIIEPLFPGYGVTIGNSLRRVLFSSLDGSAITAVRIDGVTHEFSTIKGMKEDVVGLILNLKTLRVKLLTDEPTTLRLEVKEAGEVTAKNFASNPNVKIIDSDHYLASLDKGGKLVMEVLVERGRGYVPTEQKKNESNPLGTISIDAIFTPVKKVHYDVTNTRVGKMTNFDKLTLDITTDGTIEPREALVKSAQIILEHFQVIASVGGTNKPKTSKKKQKEEVVDDLIAEDSEPKVAKVPKVKKAKTEESKNTEATKAKTK